MFEEMLRTVELSSLVTTEELKDFKVWFDKTIGTEWEVSYMDMVPGDLSDKYSSLHGITMFEINDEEIELVRLYELEHIKGGVPQWD